MPSKSKSAAVICALCRVACPDEGAYQAHLNGKKHRTYLESGEIFQCPLCEIALNGHVAWEAHLKVRKHMRRAREEGVSPQVEPQGAGAVVRDHRFCATCRAYIRDEAWSGHPGSSIHKRKLRFAATEARLEEATKDKHGITVSHSDGLDFGVVELVAATQGQQITLTVNNSVPLSNIMLLDVKLFSSFTARISG